MIHTINLPQIREVFNSGNTNQIMYIDLNELQEMEKYNKCNHMRVNLSYDLEKSIDLKKFENHVKQSENINYITIVDNELNFETLELFLHFFKNLKVIEFKNERWCNLHLMTGTFPTIKEIVINPYCIHDCQINKDFKLWFPNLTKVTLSGLKNDDKRYDIINKCLNLVDVITHITEYRIDEHTDYTIVRSHMVNIRIDKLIVIAKFSNYEMAMETITSHPEISELELCGHIKNEDFESICKKLENLKVLDIKAVNQSIDPVNQFDFIKNLGKLEHLRLKDGQIEGERMKFLNNIFPALGFTYFKYDEQTNEYYYSKKIEKPPYNFHTNHVIFNLDQFFNSQYSDIKRMNENRAEVQVHAKDFLTNTIKMNYLQINMSNISEMNDVNVASKIKSHLELRNGKVKYICISGLKFNFELIGSLLFLLLEEVEVIYFKNFGTLLYNLKHMNGKFSNIKGIIMEKVFEIDDAEDVFKNWKSWFPNVTQVKLNRFNSNYKKDQLKFVSMFVTHIDWCYLRNSGVTNYTLVKNCLSNLTIEKLWIQIDQTNYETIMDIMNSQPHITHLKYSGYIEDDHFEWICNNMCNLKELDIRYIKNLSPAAYVHIKNFKKLETLVVPKSSAHVEVIKEYLSIYDHQKSNYESYKIILCQQRHNSECIPMS